MSVIHSVSYQGVAIFSMALPAAANDSKVPSRAAERAAVESLLSYAFSLESFAPFHLSAVSLRRHPSGAPFFADSHVTVSISHCRGLAIVALDPHGRRIGIDAEVQGRAGQLRRVARKFLAPDDLALFDSDDLLLRAWTEKEAIYKAAGILGLALTDIPVALSFPALLHHPAFSVELFGIDIPDFAGMVTLAIASPSL